MLPAMAMSVCGRTSTARVIELLSGALSPGAVAANLTS
jgi:hypothetical protein